MQTNTFQCVIGTNGIVSSICLFYPEDLIQWTTGDNSGGSGGLGGDPANVGLVSEDSTASYFLNISNTDEVVDIESTGNLEINGLWVFRVDQPNIIFPGDHLLLFVIFIGCCCCYCYCCCCCCFIVAVVVDIGDENFTTIHLVSGDASGDAGIVGSGAGIVGSGAGIVGSGGGIAPEGRLAKSIIIHQVV